MKISNLLLPTYILVKNSKTFKLNKFPILYSVGDDVKWLYTRWTSLRCIIVLHFCIFSSTTAYKNVWRLYSSDLYRAQSTYKTRGNITRASLHCGHRSNCNYTLGHHQPLSAPAGRRVPLIFDPYIPIAHITRMHSSELSAVRIKLKIEWYKTAVFASVARVNAHYQLIKLHRLFNESESEQRILSAITLST